MGFIKQLFLSVAVAVAAMVAWIAWMPEARPLLERAGIWQLLEGSGALDALAVVGITPAEPGGAPSAGGPPGASGPPGGGGFAMPAPTVTVAEVIEAELSSTVTAIGTGQALRSVAVTPEAAGRITEILVRPGQQVTAGDVLARLEATSERIAVDRAELMLEDARENLARRDRLRGTGAATDVQIRDAELAVRNAELELEQRQLELSRRVIAAPIDGYVGFVPVEIGNQVTTSSEITRIDDRSLLLVDFLVPERHVERIAEGVPLTARPLARQAEALDGRVRAIDNRVDAASRSLSVQAEIENPGDRLRAGMAFVITLEFSGQSLPGVDPLAIQWDRGGSFVWVLREGRVQRVPARIVQRGSDRVLVEAALEPGEQVVREGVQMLRPGLEVRVRGADEGAGGATAGRGAGQGAAQGGGQGAGAPATARPGSGGDGAAPTPAAGSRGGAVDAPAAPAPNGRAAAAPAADAAPSDS